MVTPHQLEVANDTIRSLKKDKRAVLQGSAGVGKTWLADYIIREFVKQPNRGKICVTAPTNKAVSVIRNKVREHGLISFLTTHSALKMKLVYGTDGEKEFVSYDNPKYPILQGVQLLVVDEASMLNENMLHYIEKYVDLRDVMVLFLGDNKQINPVNETNSPVFHKGYPTHTLTEIIRQGEGNPIIDFSRNYSTALARREFDPLIDGKGYLVSNNFERIIERLAEVNGTDELKYLSWTNKDVNKINYLVRNKIYGDPAKVEKGETVIFDTPYSHQDQVIYYTNEEMKIDSLRIAEKTVWLPTASNAVTGDSSSTKMQLKLYIVNEGDKCGKGVWILHEDSEELFKKVVADLKKKAKSKLLEWKTFFQFKEQFAEIKYNHAITVHKSQGSTYKMAIMNVGNIMLNRRKEERNRLLYTAITRSSDLLILYNLK